MSTCVTENTTVFGTGHPAAPSWRDGAERALHQVLGPLNSLGTAWRARQRLRKDLRGLSEHHLKDIGLEVEARQIDLGPFWRGHTPR
jgi:uncharacterized protein YjiS (DUF1127 family)